ncbi:hypothetical protein DYU05_04870 [Mucilaginibacter terrenus]|uniref:Uncharacterized protein n=1 Tax=Mucilaginibacter terrenus TaxID=2482727 RepID=A0A3E2NVJ7_9SPHI|nr:hypothetical protein [Mucilaginibacter terrenus]RFZ84941.1 hypothetical protein DYU05_04870 [Mucilaginibacter terrenus]
MKGCAKVEKSRERRKVKGESLRSTLVNVPLSINKKLRQLYKVTGAKLNTRTKWDLLNIITLNHHFTSTKYFRY